MKIPVSLTIDKQLFDKLLAHLFPGDGDEHAAVIAAGIAETPRGTRLLARDLFLAKDGIDFVPGKRSYRLLTADFVVERSDYCAAENLCYLSVHCHGGTDTVDFSADDLASNERGYHALLDITNGGPVGALVFAHNAVAGDIWTRQGRRALSSTTVVGPRIQKFYPSPAKWPPKADPLYQTHARLFGDVGQFILSNLKVGIIGLGGGGSLLNEWLARLGVGHIVAVDFDRIDYSNLPRIVGANWWDALQPLGMSKNPVLQNIAKRFARHKVHIANRVAKQANQKIRYDAVVGNVVDQPIAQLLADVDFLFLASDTTQSRMIFNALVQQYLIPGGQVGAKVEVDPKTNKVTEIHVASRVVLPYPGGGCLECNNLISPERLRLEQLSQYERRKQRYVDVEEVKEPSVVTLNALSAAQVANDLMMMFTGLYNDTTPMNHIVNFVRERTLYPIEPETHVNCLDCSDNQKSRRARGDRARLPCRQNN